MKIAEPLLDDEDCLTLNIFTRGDGKNKPVTVWIYGGAFVGGYSSEVFYGGPNFVSAQDVVLVFLNYRLNVFDFMNFAGIDSTFEDSSCLGFKDQVAALQWVKKISRHSAATPTTNLFRTGKNIPPPIVRPWGSTPTAASATKI